MDSIKGFDSPDPRVRRVYWVRLDRFREVQVGYDNPLMVICVQGEIMGLERGASRMVEKGDRVMTRLLPGVLVHFWLIELMLNK